MGSEPEYTRDPGTIVLAGGEWRVCRCGPATVAGDTYHVNYWVIQQRRQAGENTTWVERLGTYPTAMDAIAAIPGVRARV